MMCIHLIIEKNAAIFVVKNSSLTECLLLSFTKYDTSLKTRVNCNVAEVLRMKM